MRRLLGGVVLIAIGIAILPFGFATPAGADIIAADGFNYIPIGASLDGANGGAGPSAPGWVGSWSADATATVGAGLTYSGYGGLGIGNSVTLGDVNATAGISRSIGDSSAAGNTVWMRMLYRPGEEVEASLDSATPFQLMGANSASVFNVQRSLIGGALSFSMNMTGDGSWGGTATASTNFSLTEVATHMLLFKLVINQATDQNETLSLWLDPTATTEVALGAADATISANILEGGDDYLALFWADGYGDRIDEIVLATSLTGAISQLNHNLATVTLNNLAQSYDGAAKPVSVVTSPINLAVSVTYNGIPNAPTNVGSYTVVATITDPLYYGGATNLLVITPAAAPVIIAEDGFNYNPIGASLNGANGGTEPSTPGWWDAWSADATATVGIGLTYSGYGGLGIGNSVTLGAVDATAGISRGLGDSSAAGNTVWMRMLYSPGDEVAASLDSATPFQLMGANSASGRSHQLERRGAV